MTMDKVRTARTSWQRYLILGVITIPAAALAAVSLRYLLPHPPAAPRNVMENSREAPWLPVHAGLAAVALLIGPCQLFFHPRRTRAWHRWLGRLYIACCLLSAIAGLILALGVSTGPIAAAGFGLLAIAWFVTTGLGYREAFRRRFDSHRRWMIRSYALTFAAVTLRLYLAVALFLDLDFATAYRAISFLAWVPNLVLVEVLLRWRPRLAAA